METKHLNTIESPATLTLLEFGEAETNLTYGYHELVDLAYAKELQDTIDRQKELIESLQHIYENNNISETSTLARIGLILTNYNKSLTKEG